MVEGVGYIGLGDWSLDPTVDLGLLLLLGIYYALWHRGYISRRDDVSPWFRSPSLRFVFFNGGILTLFVALQSPIDAAGDRYLLSLHMVQHLLLMMIAPPLMLLGICGMRDVGQAVPRRWRALGRNATRPWPAALTFSALLLVWHLPTLYDTTLTDQPVHVLEHLMFIAGGILFWWPVVDPWRSRTMKPVGPFEKIAMLVLSGVPQVVLGLTFALGRAPYYWYYAQAPRLWGLSPLSDQQIAGVIMLGLGNVVYFVAASVIFLRLFPEETKSASMARKGALMSPAGGVGSDGHRPADRQRALLTPDSPLGRPRRLSHSPLVASAPNGQKRQEKS